MNLLLPNIPGVNQAKGPNIHDNRDWCVGWHLGNIVPFKDLDADLIWCYGILSIVE